MNTNTPQQPIKPSRIWYLIALIIFIVGPLMGIIHLARGILFVDTFKHKIEPSTHAVINVNKPGEYTLWKESTTKNKESGFTQPSQLTITDKKSGDTLQIEPSTRWKINAKESTQYAISTIRFYTPGEYVVTFRNGDKNIHSIYLQHPSLHQVLRTIFVSILFFISGLIIGPLIALIVFVKRTNATAIAKEQPKPTSDISNLQEVNSEEKTWAVFCHLSTLTGFLIPLANIFVPLIIWLIKRKDSDFIDDQGKESINFQISILIYYIFSFILILLIVGLFLLPLLALFNVIAVIIASIEAAKGKRFRYPLCIRFLR